MIFEFVFNGFIPSKYRKKIAKLKTRLKTIKIENLSRKQSKQKSLKENKKIIVTIAALSGGLDEEPSAPCVGATPGD